MRYIFHEWVSYLADTCAGRSTANRFNETQKACIICPTRGDIAFFSDSGSFHTNLLRSIGNNLIYIDNIQLEYLSFVTALKLHQQNHEYQTEKVSAPVRVLVVSETHLKFNFRKCNSILQIFGLQKCRDTVITTPGAKRC